MSTQPKSIAGNDSLVQVYNNIPKRTLWDILWEAAAHLCPIGQESVDQATSEPQARGSIVEWIMGEAIVRECWLPKSVLKRDEPAKEEKAPKLAPGMERFIDDIPTDVVEEEKKAPKKSTRRKTRTKAAARPPDAG